MFNGCKKSHTCGELNQGSVGKTVRLGGRVPCRGDHRGLIFIDFPDRYKIPQVLFDLKIDPALDSQAKKLRSERFITLSKTVTIRGEGLENKTVLTTRNYFGRQRLLKIDTPIQSNTTTKRKIDLKMSFIIAKEPFNPCFKGGDLMLRPQFLENNRQLKKLRLTAISNEIS